MKKVKKLKNFQELIGEATGDNSVSMEARRRLQNFRDYSTSPTIRGDSLGGDIAGGLGQIVHALLMSKLHKKASKEQTQDDISRSKKAKELLQDYQDRKDRRLDKKMQLTKEQHEREDEIRRENFAHKDAHQARGFEQALKIANINANAKKISSANKIEAGLRKEQLAIDKEERADKKRQDQIILKERLKAFENPEDALKYASDPKKYEKMLKTVGGSKNPITNFLGVTHGGKKKLALEDGEKPKKKQNRGVKLLLKALS